MLVVLDTEVDFLQHRLCSHDPPYDDIFKSCRNKYSHTFEYRFVCDFNFTNTFDNKEIFRTTHRSMEFKTDFYGLNKKSKMLDKEVLYFYIKQTNNKNLFTSTIYNYALLSKITNTYKASTFFQITFSKS